MSDFDGEAGQVQEMQYCMKDSWQAKNVDEMSKMAGYHNLSDLSNTPKPPTKMEGSKRNTQIMGNGSGDEDYNYNANRS